MSIIEIDITSNSNPISIRKAFESYISQLKLHLSLEIEINKEESILQSVVEQLQSFTHLEELYIIISRQCILEQFHILTEGLIHLINLKVFSITFQSQCCGGETQFQHLLLALKRMVKLQDLRLCVESCNSLNQKVIKLFNKSLSYMSSLLKLKIQIQEGNQFDDQTAEELSKGFNNNLLLEELDISLDVTYITEKGMISINNLLKRQNKTLIKLKIVLEGRCRYQGLSNIFESLDSLSKLRELTIQSFQQLNIGQLEMKRIVESLSKLTYLESLSMQKIFGYQYVNGNIHLIKQLQYFFQLKKLDIEIINLNKVSNQQLIILQDSFSSLKYLEDLKLTISDSTSFENQLTRLLANSFEQLNKLTSLELKLQCTVNQIEGIHLMESLKNVKNIQNLKLTLGSGFFLDETVLDYLGESLRHLTNLRQLHLIIPNSDNTPFQQLTCEANERDTYSNGIKRLINRKKLLQYNLDLNKLQNLEELILKNNEDIEIEGQNILPSLKNLKKLKILDMSCNIDKREIVHSFSSAFINLNCLTDLNLSIKINQHVLQNEQQNLFKSFSSLTSLINLNLQFNEYIAHVQLKSLGQSLQFLTKITSFSLELQSQFSSLECLQSILDGFSNCKLKTFKFKTDNLISFTSYSKDLKLFRALQYLENLSLETIKIQKTKEDERYDILIGSLKELQNLRKIEIVVDYDGFQNQNNLTQLLQSLPTLIEFKVIDRKNRSDITTLGYNLLEDFQRKLKVKDINLVYTNNDYSDFKIYSLMKQLENLHSLSLEMHQGIFLETYYKNNKSLLNDSLKFLTKLEFYIQQEKAKHCYYHLLSDEFRQLKQLKYLTDLSIDFSKYNGVKELEMKTLGQSLQQIDQIKDLEIKLTLTDHCTVQGLVDLSKGISNQKHLKTLCIVLINESQNTEQSKGVISIIESFKLLSYLTNLKLVLINKLGFYDQMNQYNEFLLGLEKSLSFISHIRILNISFENNKSQEINEGLSSLANILEQNVSLVSLRIELSGFIINDIAAQRFGKCLSKLKQLEECEMLFSKSLVNNSSGLFTGINSLKSLRYFKLIVNVKTFSFSPLGLILNQQEGKYTSLIHDRYFLLKEFYTQFQGPQIEITISQSSENKFPVNEVEKLTKYLRKLPSGIEINLGFTTNIFSFKLEHEKVFKVLSPLLIKKLQLQIFENHITFWKDGRFKMKQVKSLDVVFSEDKLKNDQILTSLNSLSKKMGKITELTLHLQNNFKYDKSKIYNFISAIIKFSSIQELYLKVDSYDLKQQAFVYQSLVRKLPRLAILKVSNFDVSRQPKYGSSSSSSDDDDYDED